MYFAVDDDNRSRREAVRRKTAQYLLKAEDLYNRHLATKGTDELRWAVSTVNPVDLPMFLICRYLPIRLDL